MNRRTTFILILAAFALHAWPFFLWLSDTGLRENAFVPPPRNTAAHREKPFMKEDFIIPDQGPGMVHVASICEMPEGKFVASWYGGTREGAKDVAIFLSSLSPKEEAAGASRKLSRTGCPHPENFADTSRKWAIPWCFPIP